MDLLFSENAQLHFTTCAVFFYTIFLIRTIHKSAETYFFLQRSARSPRCIDTGKASIDKEIIGQYNSKRIERKNKLKWVENRFFFHGSASNTR